MQEPAGPATTSLLVVFIAFLGPTLGPFALIAFAAAAGCLVPLTRREASSRTEGLMYVLSAVAMALVFVGPAAWLLQKYADLPAGVVLAPLAAVVGLYRDKLLESLENVLTGLPAALANLNPFAGRGRSGQ